MRPNIVKQAKRGTAGDGTVSPSVAAPVLGELHTTSEQLSWSRRNRHSPQPSLKSPHRAQAQAGPTGLRPKAATRTDPALPHKHRAPAVGQEVFGLKGFQTKQKTKEKVEPTRNAQPHTTVNTSTTLTLHRRLFPQAPR